MKRPLLLLALSAVPLLAQDAFLLPAGRTFIEVRENERNPFGAQVSVETPQVVEEAESEEARLRRLVRAMRVSGVSGVPGEYRAMLGSLVLKPGDRLPSLLRNQFEILRVTSITPEAVQISFVERDVDIEPRQIIVPVTLAPRVRQLLFGEVFEDVAQVGPDGRVNLEELEVRGVNDILKGANESAMENLVDRPVRFLGDQPNETPSSE